MAKKKTRTENERERERERDVMVMKNGNNGRRRWRGGRLNLLLKRATAVIENYGGRISLAGRPR